jgi:hypothetical protein
VVGNRFGRFGRSTRRFAALALVVVPLSLSFGASSADAGLGIACPDPTYQPFRAWSDYAQYAQVPDGGFEAGAAGWALSGGAQVVAGNNPFYLRNASDRSSLLLPAGSSATSPPMCISLLSSKMRFVVGGPTGSSMKVRVLYRGLLSRVVGVLDGGTVTSGGTWAPSPEVAMLGGLLPLLTQSVQFQLVSTSGLPQADDVFLDPWKIG